MIRKRALLSSGGVYVLSSLQLPIAGKTFYDLRRQMQALAAARLTLGFTNGTVASTLAVQPIERFDAWLVKDGEQMALWPAVLHLSPAYHQSLLEHAVPLPMTAIAALSHSATALDVLAWLGRRLPELDKPLRVPFVSLKEQFGQEYDDPKNFKKKFLGALKQVLAIYRDANIEPVTGGLLLRPSRSIVPKPMIQGHKASVYRLVCQKRGHPVCTNLPAGFDPGERQIADPPDRTKPSLREAHVTILASCRR